MMMKTSEDKAGGELRFLPAVCGMWPGSVGH